MPVHIVERLQKMNRAERTLWTALGREPTLEEIADEANLTLAAGPGGDGRRPEPRRASTLRSAGDTDDAVLRRLRGRRRSAAGGDGGARGCAARRSGRHSVHCRTGSVRSWTLRYGLGGTEPKTLEEIGRRLGLTRERVRQIELDSLRRLAVQREMQAVMPRTTGAGGVGPKAGAGGSGSQVQLEGRVRRIAARVVRASRAGAPAPA